MKNLKIGDEEIRKYLENSKSAKYVNYILKSLIGEESLQNPMVFIYENYVYSKNFINGAIRKTLDILVKNTGFIFKKPEKKFVF